MYCSPALVGFTFIQPNSYVYRFVEDSKELVVIKTRALHVPPNTTEVWGFLKKYQGSNIGCDDYNDKILLINSGKDWNDFCRMESRCGIKAAVIKIGDEKKNRSSSPLLRINGAKFPTVWIYKKDEIRLGKLLKKYQKSHIYS